MNLREWFATKGDGSKESNYREKSSVSSRLELFPITDPWDEFGIFTDPWMVDFDGKL